AREPEGERAPVERGHVSPQRPVGEPRHHRGREGLPRVGEPDRAVEPEERAHREQRRGHHRGGALVEAEREMVEDEGAAGAEQDRERHVGERGIREGGVEEPPEGHVEQVARRVRLVLRDVELVQGERELHRVPVVEHAGPVGPAREERHHRQPEGQREIDVRSEEADRPPPARGDRRERRANHERGERAEGRGETGLRLLLVVLLHRRRVVLQLVDALLELLDAAPERAGEVRQALGAEQDQHDDEDQQQLLVSQTKHWRDSFPFPDAPLPYAPAPGLSTRPCPSRSTRRSPTRTVTRWVSKYSIRGMAYFRLTPKRSLKSAGPISFFWRRRVTSCSWMVRSASAWKKSDSFTRSRVRSATRTWKSSCFSEPLTPSRPRASSGLGGAAPAAR